MTAKRIGGKMNLVQLENDLRRILRKLEAQGKQNSHSARKLRLILAGESPNVIQNKYREYVDQEVLDYFAREAERHGYTSEYLVANKRSELSRSIRYKVARELLQKGYNPKTLAQHLEIGFDTVRKMKKEMRDKEDAIV